MAEKKFFVDINLQGSALTNAKIGTNTGIGSTEGAFGYDSSAHRLQYFDGTATKEVANLSDIAAVTGGLIFQGGYDPTTDTPDITDGSALKGFFWVATAAGTFLGEAVQVGDSIVAKADAAGTTLSDWLILQGNVVIATDSVDGISRLATQTEANDGTEAGAVVITPATLQGKIDAQITPEINNKLPLTGGTMDGTINMNGEELLGASISNSALTTDLDANSNKITNLLAPVDGGDAANKTYVDDNTSNKLPLAGGTMTGDIDMDGNQIDGAVIVSSRLDTGLWANNNKITDLATPTNGGDAANKTYVDDQDALKVSKSGDTMSGNLDMGGNNITNGLVIQGQSIETDELTSYNNADINLSVNLDAQNTASIINLPAPTANGDATNKEYVDNAVAAQSFSGTIFIADWFLEPAGHYTAQITHSLNSEYPVVNLYDLMTLQSIEMMVTPENSNVITVYSNFIPTGDIKVSIVKVG